MGYKDIFRVGHRHPRVALQYEMMMLPLIWEAERRCIEFWLKVMGMDDRKLQLVALEAQEPQNKVKWWEDMKCGLEKVGWTSEMAEKLKGVVSGSEVSQMLKVWKGWLKEAYERLKLGMLQRLMGRGCKLRCVQVGRKVSDGS